LMFSGSSLQQLELAACYQPQPIAFAPEGRVA
jgi:hypothetical protein